MSESEIARFLIDKGKSVRPLPDNYMRGRQSPDMFSSDDKLQMYIEVKRFTEDGTIDYFSEELRSFLNRPDRFFRVDVKLGRLLSMPAIRRNERKKKKEIAKKCIEEFKKKFMQDDLSCLPVQINTSEAIFEIHKSGLKRDI